MSQPIFRIITFIKKCCYITSKLCRAKLNSMRQTLIRSMKLCRNNDYSWRELCHRLPKLYAANYSQYWIYYMAECLNVFFYNTSVYFQFLRNEKYSLTCVSNAKYISINLASNWQQAITWTSNGLVCWHIKASLDLSVWTSPTISFFNHVSSHLVIYNRIKFTNIIIIHINYTARSNNLAAISWAIYHWSDFEFTTYSRRLIYRGLTRYCIKNNSCKVQSAILSIHMRAICMECLSWASGTEIRAWISNYSRKKCAVITHPCLSSTAV